MIMPRKAMVAAIAVVAVFGGAVALYVFALPGFSSARRQPPEIEVAVATGCCAIVCRPRLDSSTIRSARTQPTSPPGATCPGKIARSATAMMAVGGRPKCVHLPVTQEQALLSFLGRKRAPKC